jgi:hypothetical protein
MSIPWNPTKQDIERWLTTKDLKFSQKEYRNSKYILRQYLEMYVFIDLHEVFFYYFTHFLQEWILILKDNQESISG